MRPLSWLQCRGVPLSGCRPLLFLALAHFVLWKMLQHQGLKNTAVDLFLTRRQAGWAGTCDVAGAESTV